MLVTMRLSSNVSSYWFGLCAAVLQKCVPNNTKKISVKPNCSQNNTQTSLLINAKSEILN